MTEPKIVSKKRVRGIHGLAPIDQKTAEELVAWFRLYALAKENYMFVSDAIAGAPLLPDGNMVVPRVTIQVDQECREIPIEWHVLRESCQTWVEVARKKILERGGVVS